MQKKRVGMARWLVMTEQVFLILQQDAEKVAVPTVPKENCGALDPDKRVV